MTVKDDEKFCVPCKKIGLDRKAHRIMPGGGGRCDEHFRDEQGLPQLNEEAKRFIEMCKARAADSTAALPDVPRPSHAVEAPKPMRQKFDYKAMQADRDAKMKPGDIAKKYGCSYQSVIMNTHQRADPMPVTKPRGPYKKKKPALAAATTVNGDFAATIADLKKKRAGYAEKIAAIDDVILNLEKLT